jgi:hypothetical protein
MSKIGIIFTYLLLIFTVNSTDFDITKAGKDGSVLYKTTCNIQTTLEFQFSSQTTLTSSATVNNHL